MNQETEDFLEHHGVKGMKWGVRKVGRAAGDRTKEERKADKKWARAITWNSNAMNSHVFRGILLNARLKTAGDIKRLNGDQKFSAKNLLSPSNVDLRRDYHAKVSEIYSKHLNDEAHRVFGKDSPSGMFNVSVGMDKLRGPHLVINLSDTVDHADGQLVVILKLDPTGHVVDFEEPKLDELVQGEIDPFDEFIEHFGVKGMKWGIRRDPSGTHGGAHGSAKKDPLEDISDDDLKKMVSRLQMEQQFRTLQEKSRNKTAVDHGAEIITGLVIPAVKVAFAGAITAKVAKALRNGK